MDLYFKFQSRIIKFKNKIFKKRETAEKYQTQSRCKSRYEREDRYIGELA